MTSAAAIVEHCNKQKFIVLDLNEQGMCQNDPIDTRLVRLLSAATKKGDGSLTSSEVSQKHISEKVDGSYPIVRAIQLMEEAERLGFGKVVTATTPNNRIVKTFRKRPLTELSLDCHGMLKRFKVSNEKYNTAFKRPLQELQEN